MKSFLHYMISRNGFQIEKTRFITPFFSKCSFNPFSTEIEKNPADLDISADMADFLEKSCGFSSEKASEIVNRPRSPLRLQHSKKKAERVIKFLRRTGFDETHVKKIVDKLPGFLVCNVKKTLKPRVEVLQDLGLSISGVGELMSFNPNISNRPVSPAIEFLRKLLDDDKKVIQCLRLFGFCNFNSLQETVEGNLHVLQGCGFVPTNLGTLMCRHPMMFKKKPEHLAECVERAKSLGFDVQDKMFPEALGVICQMNKSSWEEKLEMYKSHGWTEQDIVLGFRKYPKFILLSESKVKKVLNFFMNELKYSPLELATKAGVFTASLEKRILPRYMVFKKLQSEGMWKGKTPDFLGFVKIIESRFQKKRVLFRLKDSFPDVYQTYLKAVSSNK